MDLNLVENLRGLVFLLLLVLCWKYWRFVRKFKDFPSCRFEGKWLFSLITGKYFQNAPLMSILHFEIMDILKTFQKEGLCVLWFFMPRLFVFSHEHLKVLITNSSISEKSPQYKLLGDAKGLFVMNGSEWRERKKICTRAIQLDIIKGQLHTFNRCAKAFVKELLEVTDKPSVDLYHALNNVASRSLFETVFGVQKNNEKYEQNFQKFEAAAESVDRFTMGIFLRPWLQKKCTRLLFQSGRQYQKSLNEVSSVVKRMTAEVMKSNFCHSSDAPKDQSGCPKCCAQVLIEHHLKDPSFTMEDVHIEVRMLMMGGVVTVSLTMLHCLLKLGLNPEVQEKVFEEVCGITGSSNTDVSYDELQQLKYLESVIQETLRLYPVFSIVERKVKKEVVFGKYKIPKNTHVIFAPWLLHRDPNIFPDPEKFDPERFYTKSVKQPWTYIPFAEGVRSCIGKTFAMIELKMFLAHVLRSYEITCVNKEEDISPCWEIAIKPLNPIYFKITRRKSSLLPQE